MIDLSVDCMRVCMPKEIVESKLPVMPFSISNLKAAAGVANVASTVTAGIAARNAVMIRLTKAWPPSESFLMARTICGTSTVFSAPPANNI